jgi:hypothetical protein
MPRATKKREYECMTASGVYTQRNELRIRISKKKVNVKVKVTLKQAMKAQRGSRGISLLFL